MKKSTILLWAFLFVSLITLVYLFTIDFSEDEQQPIILNDNVVVKVPLYYDLDNSDQPLVFEKGDYKEVVLNG